MKRTYTFTILLLAVSMAIYCQKPTYKIEGFINCTYNDSLIMLFKFKGDTIFSVDTTTVTNSTFNFQGIEDLTDLSMISIGNYPETVKTVEVALEKGLIKINMDSMTVSGTKLNNTYKIHLQTFDKYTFKLDSLYNKDKNQAMIATSELNVKYREFNNYKKQFIINNLQNPVGLRVFFDGIQNINDIDFFEILDSLPKNYLSDKRIVFEKENRIERSKKNENRKTLVGEKYLDFDFHTPENKKCRLSDYIGKTKYVFIDFWASWCSPCIAEIPILERIYNEYRAKGLEIISISLDTNLEQWRKTIQRIDAPWVHLSNLKGYSELTTAYKVDMIPMAFLIDENGIIIEQNLRGESLEKFLQKQFNE